MVTRSASHLQMGLWWIQAHHVCNIRWIFTKVNISIYGLLFFPNTDRSKFFLTICCGFDNCPHIPMDDGIILKNYGNWGQGLSVGNRSLGHACSLAHLVVEPSMPLQLLNLCITISSAKLHQALCHSDKLLRQWPLIFLNVQSFTNHVLHSPRWYLNRKRTSVQMFPGQISIFRDIGST